MSGAVVLLIACCNVANLLVARATLRRPEFAIRLALGAGRARLVRQLITESALLAMLGGAIGLGIAKVGSRLLVTLASDPFQPLRFELYLDRRIILFTSAVSLLTIVLFGLVPAFRAASGDPIGLGRGSRGHTGSAGSRRLGKAILVAQVGLSLPLLVGAGLLVRTLHALRTSDAGVNREQVLLLEVVPDRSVLGRWRPGEFNRLSEQIDARLAEIPGVRSSAVSTYPPFTDRTNRRGAVVAGYAPAPGESHEVHQLAVSPAFFDVMGMTLVQGRAFDRGDTERSRRVVIVNETTARFLFRGYPGGETPVGKFMALGRVFRQEAAMEVVAVVKDAKYADLREPFRRSVYFPEAQVGFPFFAIQVRVEGPPMALFAEVERALQHVKEGLIIVAARTLEDQIERTLTRERMFARLCGAFGILALALACIGLYGILSHAVARRTPEIGIRMALGARRGAAIGLVVREAAILMLGGIAIGVPVSLATGRLLENLLFGLGPGDPPTIAGAAILLLAVGVLAAYLPARRVARIDPNVALRYE